MGAIEYSQRTFGSLEPRRTSFFEGVGKKLAESRKERQVGIMKASGGGGGGGA